MEIKPRLDDFDMAHLQGIIAKGYPLPVRTGRPKQWRCSECGYETNNLEDYTVHYIINHSDKYTVTSCSDTVVI